LFNENYTEFYMIINCQMMKNCLKRRLTTSKNIT